MKLLITGSSGFIGERLIHQLNERGIPYDVLKRQQDNSAYAAGTSEVVIPWPEGISALNLSGYSAIVHLATAPVTQQSSLDSLRRDNLRPVELFLSSLSGSRSEASFIFVTSQSASATAESLYGKIKWECEERIRSHQGNWTIIRPGLVVGGGAKGLFARMLTVVKRFPVVPLVGSGENLLQPIDIDSVVSALIASAVDVTHHTKQDYALAIEPVSLKTFLSEAAQILRKKRLFIPVPLPLLSTALGLVELILPNPPITRTNLLGLLHLKVIDGSSSAKALGIEYPPLQTILAQALGQGESNALRKEAKIFHEQLFHRAPTARFIERYEIAHQYCCKVTEGMTPINLQAACEHELDIEAIEFALRRKKTVLSKKLALVCFLAEQEPEHFQTFVNEQRAFAKGFAILAFHALTAPLKLLKGIYLSWRYGLV